MTPAEDFAERCHVLHERGLGGRVMADLAATGDFHMLAAVEALDNEHLAQLTRLAPK